MFSSLNLIKAVRVKIRDFRGASKRKPASDGNKSIYAANNLTNPPTTGYIADKHLPTSMIILQARKLWGSDIVVINTMP